MITKLIYSNDLALTQLPNGKYDLVLIFNSDYIRTKLKTRLNFFLGEWFADVRQGFPYKTRVLVNSPNILSIRSLFYQAIMETPGIVNVINLSMNFDKANRALAVEFQATMSNGQVLSVDPRIDTDFIINLIGANSNIESTGV